MTAFAADVNVACVGDLVGTTFTLTANCATTAPITVPPTITTVDGGGFTISATDPGAQWDGAILTNATAGQSMTIQHLIVSGPPTGFQVCTNSTNTLVGILFSNASGTVNDVVVDHIWQQQTTVPSCQTGRAIVARDATTQRTVTITDTMVQDYQKNGIEARGSVTMNVSAETVIGPPHLPMEGLIAQNGLVYVSGASGTATGNTIYGSGDQQPPGPPGGGSDGTAVLLWGSTNVTIDQNTITGAKTDIGIAVVAGSTGSVISFNTVGRTAPDDPDPSGIGVVVDSPNARVSPDGPGLPRQGTSGATLICNTFSGWNTNIVGAVQMSCTPLPPGTECRTYSASVLGVEGGTAPFTWSVASGALPPGLNITASDGSITGTPTSAGTFDFDVMVVDSTPQAPLSATQPQTITVAPDCAADLGLTKVVSNATPKVGDQVTFTVTLTNNGPDTATGVQVTDLVPAGLTFVSATPSQGTYATATGLWNVGTVTVGTPQTLQLVVTVASAGTQTNTARITASDQADPNTGNNTASADLAQPTTTTTTTSTTTTTVAPTTTTTAAPTTTIKAGSGGQLPATGSGTAAPLYLGLALLALGSLAVIISIRRRANHT